MTAEETMKLLEENEVDIPRRLTPSFVTSLKDILPKKYLMTGGVSIWKKGSVGWPAASATDVSISLTMYDIENGEVVWAVSGQEEGASGILAEKPEEKAKIVLEKMIKKWPEFCKTSNY